MMYIYYGPSILCVHMRIQIHCMDVSRLTVVSRGAKKKQAVHDERVSYLQIAPL